MGSVCVLGTLGEEAEWEGKGWRPPHTHERVQKIQEAEGSSEPQPRARGSPGNQRIVLPNSMGDVTRLITAVTRALVC